jgi:hypothetical protein
VTKPDAATTIIVDAAKKVLIEVEHRCGQALKALEQNDHLVALGAIIGFEEQIRSINVRLMVLREIYEIRKHKSIKEE